MAGRLANMCNVCYISGNLKLLPLLSSDNIYMHPLGNRQIAEIILELWNSLNTTIGLEGYGRDWRDGREDGRGKTRKH